MNVISKAIRNKVRALAALAALSLVFGSAAAAQPAPAPSPRPALWLLADEDTKIYLFGTLHLLPPGLVWRSAALDSVIASADELVMETRKAMLRRRCRSGPPAHARQAVPLIERVSPDRRPALRQLLAATGLPSETLDGMQTWVAAMVLEIVASPGSGRHRARPEFQLRPPAESKKARCRIVRSDRPVLGLETPQMQLGYFSICRKACRARFWSRRSTPSIAMAPHRSR